MEEVKPMDIEGQHSYTTNKLTSHEESTLQSCLGEQTSFSLPAEASTLYS
jgi:hypothetical protein